MIPVGIEIGLRMFDSSDRISHSYERAFYISPKSHQGKTVFGFTNAISSLANRGLYQCVHNNPLPRIRIGQNISTLYKDRTIRFSNKSKTLQRKIRA